jgi:hypothetical protein
MGFHQKVKKGIKIMGKIIGSPVFRQHNPATFIRVSMLQVHPASSCIIQFSFHDDHLEAVPLSGQCGVTDGNFAVGMGFVGSWRRFLWGPLKTQSLNLDLVWIKSMFSPFHPFSCIFIHFSSVVSLDIRQGPDRLPSQPRPLPMRTGGRLQPQLTQPGQRSGACCGILWCN